MADIAAAAGVHRATLYRHFPEREDLIAALKRRAMEEAADAIDAARPEEGPALMSSGTTAEPMNPDAPVTKTRMIFTSSSSRSSGSWRPR